MSQWFDTDDDDDDGTALCPAGVPASVVSILCPSTSLGSLNGGTEVSISCVQPTLSTAVNCICTINLQLTTIMSLVNGYRIKCQNYKRMAEREKEMKRREEKLGRY